MSISYVCPKCRSTKLDSNKVVFNENGTGKENIECLDCGCKFTFNWVIASVERAPLPK